MVGHVMPLIGVLAQQTGEDQLVEHVCILCLLIYPSPDISWLFSCLPSGLPAWWYMCCTRSMPVYTRTYRRSLPEWYTLMFWRMYSNDNIINIGTIVMIAYFFITHSHVQPSLPQWWPLPITRPLQLSKWMGRKSV